MDDAIDQKDLNDNTVDWYETADVPSPIIEETLSGGEHEHNASPKSQSPSSAPPPPAPSTQLNEENKKITDIRNELIASDMSHARVHLFDKAPRWVRTTVNNWAAQYRGKVNEKVTDQEDLAEGMFTKHVRKSERGGDTLDGLRREYRFLELLKNTGVTPTPLTLKFSSDGTEGNLLMTQVPGQSLEEIAASDEELPTRFSEIFLAVRKALTAIHTHGVAVVDVNEGTFVIDGLHDPAAPITTHVVDFELAAEIDDIVSGNMKKAITEYQLQDLGFALALERGERTVTADLIKKIERYSAAREVLRTYIGEEPISPGLLPPEERSRYESQLRQIKPVLAAMKTRELRQRYQQEKEHNIPNLPDSIDSYIQENLDFEIPYDLNDLMLNITAPYALEDFGISVDPQVLQLLQQDLSPFIEDRATA